MKSLSLGEGVVLGDVHVRCLRYDGDFYDVEINFRLKDSVAPSTKALVEALHAFACRLADHAGVESYFAGLEPAADEDTRIFTGKDEGPYYRLA
ncbi:MAG: hypothetical protein MJD61_04915 [Proteobacteria bacterium]|nr:hypothetical protein [Pseudomonadota bacterium]